MRRFDGWEPTTTYAYDENNRLISSTPEAEWSPLEAGWMLALAEYEAGLCGECGHPLEETLTTAPEDWRVLPPARCAVCTRISISQEAVVAENQRVPGGGHVHALRWRAVRKKPTRG